MRNEVQGRSQTIHHLMCLAPILALLLVFFLVPLAKMFGLSFLNKDSYTLFNYEYFLFNPIYTLVILNTFKLAFLVMVLCLLLGYPVAYVASLSPPRFRGFLLIFVLVPYFTSILVRTYAWMIILGRQGVINHFLYLFGIGPLPLSHSSFGVYAGMVHVLLPLMIFPLYAGMTNIDRKVVLAARSLGGSPMFTFVRIFLPLSLPGVIAGCGLVFLTGLGFFITPALLGRLEDSTISMVIERQINISLNWGFASTLAIALLLATGLVFVVAATVGALASRTLRVSKVSLYGRS